MSHSDSPVLDGPKWRDRTEKTQGLLAETLKIKLQNRLKHGYAFWPNWSLSSQSHRHTRIGGVSLVKRTNPLQIEKWKLVLVDFTPEVLWSLKRVLGKSLDKESSNGRNSMSLT